MTQRDLMKGQVSNFDTKEHGLLNVTDDEPEAWRICWALIDNASKLPDINRVRHPCKIFAWQQPSYTIQVSTWPANLL
jgi:hypothetical protein